MGWIGILYVTGMLIVTSGLTFGGYMLQRDRYWMRVWEDMGKPEVNSIKELKAYMNNQSCTTIGLSLDQDGIESEKR